MSFLPSGFKSRAFLEFKQAQINGVSCSDCHTGTPYEKQFKDRRAGALLHLPRLDPRQANKQSHHPLKEGLMKCTQCHDQHGSSGPKMLKADTVMNSVSSVMPRSAGRFCGNIAGCRNCLTCHVPHGSNHGSFYLRSRHCCVKAAMTPLDIPEHYTRFETFPGSATSGKNRIIARGCLNCHSNIHGSMGPR